MLEIIEHKKFIETVLNDSNSKNAFSLSIAREIRTCFANAKHKSWLLRAQGPVFCSGGQLKDYANLDSSEQGIAVNNEIRAILHELSQMPVAKTALVDGHCFGGGIELLSCFDYVVATPKSLFALWQKRIGLSFGWGGKRRLESRVGSETLKKWFLSSPVNHLLSSL